MKMFGTQRSLINSRLMGTLTGSVELGILREAPNSGAALSLRSFHSTLK